MDEYLNALKKYKDFSGKATRSDFWIYLGFHFLFLVIAITCFAATYPSTKINIELCILISLAPCISLCVRRLHDIEYSGWWILVVLIPQFGPILLLTLMVLPSKSTLQNHSRILEKNPINYEVTTCSNTEPPSNRKKKFIENNIFYKFRLVLLALSGIGVFAIRQKLTNLFTAFVTPDCSPGSGHPIGGLFYIVPHTYFSALGILLPSICLFLFYKGIEGKTFDKKTPDAQYTTNIINILGCFVSIALLIYAVTGLSIESMAQIACNQ